MADDDIYGNRKSYERFIQRMESIEVKSKSRKYHLTTDEQRFQLVKQSAKNVSIVRCEGDLANPRFLKEAGEILRRQGLSISFVNLSNVYEHAPGVHESLPNLPFRDGAVFVWSNRAFGNYLGSQLSQGSEDYLKHAKGAYTQFITGQRKL